MNSPAHKCTHKLLQGVYWWLFTALRQIGARSEERGNDACRAKITRNQRCAPETSTANEALTRLALIVRLIGQSGGSRYIDEKIRR